MSKKSKGGKRAGAGRPPLADAKENIPLRVAKSDIKKWGGKAELKKKLYEFIAFPSQLSYVDFPMIPPRKQFSPSDFGAKQTLPVDYIQAKKIGAIKSDGTIIKDTTKPSSALKPQEATMGKFEEVFARDAILKEMEAIKAEKCPKERDTPMGRRSWAVDQHKRIQELQQKLL